jgi:hypothetical protein
LRRIVLSPAVLFKEAAEVRSVRIFVLLVNVLAGGPSLASAQSASAWILWEKNFTAKGDTGTTTWEPQDGYVSLASCRTSAQQLLKFALEYMKSMGGKPLGPVQLDGRAVMFALTDAGVQQRIDIRYLCFPGTFDPRQRP